MRDVGLQQLIPAAVAEHANQRVIDFDKAAVGGGEEQPFLNVVEQFAVALFHFQAVADVLQHVNGLHALAAGAVDARGRDQVSAFQHGMDILIIPFAGAAAERAGASRRGLARGQQGGHVDPDERLRLYSDKVSEGTVYPQDIAGFVMGHDEIADGIENFNPVPVGLVHAGKKAGIFQRDGSVARDGLQDLVVIVCRRSVRDLPGTGRRPVLAEAAQQPDQGALASAQLRGQRCAN